MEARRSSEARAARRQRARRAHRVPRRASAESRPEPGAAAEALAALAAARAERAAAEAALQAARLRVRDAEVAVADASGRPPTVDFGFLAFEGGAGQYTANDPDSTPDSLPKLAARVFAREFVALANAITGKEKDPFAAPEDGDECIAFAGGGEECISLQYALAELTLSNDAVWDRERKRESAGGAVASPLAIKAPYYILCYMLDVLFDGRPISRFWFLETVARMPYFSYISMLHLYETLGWWRRGANIKRVHFAEEYNEFHHLLIMESLGGDRRWADRFMAQHAAIVYYWVLVALWLFSPTWAYNFSELVEAHAVDTYSEFVDSNEQLLRELPAPEIARLYYEGNDLYLFDEFQSSREPGSRRPRADTLYDIFCNIRDDESEHVATMAACQDDSVLVTSPNAASLNGVTQRPAGVATSTVAVATAATAAAVALDIVSLSDVAEALAAARDAAAALARSPIDLLPAELREQVKALSDTWPF